jgi:hypothetical protein
VISRWVGRGLRAVTDMARQAALAFAPSRKMISISFMEIWKPGPVSRLTSLMIALHCSGVSMACPFESKINAGRSSG